MTFQEWWYEIGSGIRPRETDDYESFARRIAFLAWVAANTEGGDRPIEAPETAEPPEIFPGTKDALDKLSIRK